MIGTCQTIHQSPKRGRVMQRQPEQTHVRVGTGTHCHIYLFPFYRFIPTIPPPTARPGINVSSECSVVTSPYPECLEVSGREHSIHPSNSIEIHGCIVKSRNKSMLVPLVITEVEYVRWRKTVGPSKGPDVQCKISLKDAVWCAADRPLESNTQDSSQPCPQR